MHLDIKKVTALTVTEFISRIKLGFRLRVPCRAMAERDLRDKQNQGLPMDALANKNKDDFGRSARSYILHLFGTVQSQKSLTTDLMKGLGSFDLDTLLHDPLSHADYCFTQLFTSFRLRGYFFLVKRLSVTRNTGHLLTNSGVSIPNCISRSSSSEILLISSLSSLPSIADHCYRSFSVLLACV